MALFSCSERLQQHQRPLNMFMWFTEIPHKQPKWFRAVLCKYNSVHLIVYRNEARFGGDGNAHESPSKVARKQFSIVYICEDTAQCIFTASVYSFSMKIIHGHKTRDDPWHTSHTSIECIKAGFTATKYKVVFEQHQRWISRRVLWKSW